MPGADHSGLTLADAQFVMAKEHGFTSWPALVRAVQDQPSYDLDPDTATIAPQLGTGSWSADQWPALLARSADTGATGLNGVAALDDTALALVAEHPHLTRLDLSACRRLDPARLAERLHTMPWLEELTLDDPLERWVDEAFLARVAELPSLRRLSLRGQAAVTDAGVAHLSGCTNLVELDVTDTRAGNGAIAALAGLPSLRVLRLGPATTDSGLRSLHDLPRFATWPGDDPDPAGFLHLEATECRPTHLVLDGRITNRGLSELAGLDGLTGLTLLRLDGSVTARGVSWLRELRRLAFVHLNGDLCDDDTLRQLSRFPALRMLRTEEPLATMAGFLTLTGLSTLEHVWSPGPVRATGYFEHPPLPALRSLCVGGKGFPFYDWTQIAGEQSHLETIAPAGWTDHDATVAPSFGKLREALFVHPNSASDKGLANLAGLPLRRFAAVETSLTDCTLEMLAGMRTLERIELRCCHHVTAAGVARLRNLPNLRRLDIDDPAQTIGRRAALDFPPRVTIRYRAQ